MPFDSLAEAIEIYRKKEAERSASTPEALARAEAKRHQEYIDVSFYCDACSIFKSGDLNNTILVKGEPSCAAIQKVQAKGFVVKKIEVVYDKCHKLSDGTFCVRADSTVIRYLCKLEPDTTAD